MIDLILISVTFYLSYNRPIGIPSYSEFQIPKGLDSYIYIILFAVGQSFILPIVLPNEGITYFNLILILIWQAFIYDCMIYLLWGRFRIGRS